MFRVVGFRHFQGVQIEAHYQIRLPAGVQVRHKAGGLAHAFKPAGVRALGRGPLARLFQHGGGGQAHAPVRIKNFAAHAWGVAQRVEHVRREGRAPEFRPARFGPPVQFAPPADHGRGQLRVRIYAHGRFRKSTGTRTRCPALLLNSR